MATFYKVSVSFFPIFPFLFCSVDQECRCFKAQTDGAHVTTGRPTVTIGSVSHTNSGRDSRMEGVITESPKEGGLPDAGVSHHNNLEEAVRKQGSTFVLRKTVGLKEG